ncbi:MAG: hypothetical protein ABI181_08390 [Mycobacteriaceae bacterium]
MGAPERRDAYGEGVNPGARIRLALAVLVLIVVVGYLVRAL